jgi:anhydro-N-acetylmuramic acid kinase
MTGDGLFIGLMSGTSVDAVDAALLEWTDGRPQLRHTHSHPLPAALRERILAVSRGNGDDLHSLCTLDRELGELFAQAALALLLGSGRHPRVIRAIGSHGQTVRHRPPGHGETPYTLQIGDANTLAERTGITTVADFRRRDMAAGGEGAPLVPLFHAEVFGAPGERRAIVNIGGIANATLLDGHRVVAGFDCGPGNTLLDAWVQAVHGEQFDAGGSWAAEHDVDAALLQRLLDDPWFSRSGPRSTGPEHFNLDWLRANLAAATTSGIAAGTVQATLAELSARGIARSLADSDVTGVWVCGGGALNTDLMRRLHRLLTPAGCTLASTEALGMRPQWVEAAAFAWLARQRLLDRAGSSPDVTGACGARVLGAIYAGAAPARSDRE